MAGTGPRDWVPPSRHPAPVVSLRMKRPRRRRVGGFRRGLALSLLVVPAATAAWVFLWQYGVISSIVAVLASVGALWLFRLGSAGPVSRRGAIAVTVVATLTVPIGIAAAVAFHAARGGGDILVALADWNAWLTTALVGLALGLTAMVPALWSATTGRTFSRAAELGISVLGLALAIAAQAFVPALTPATAEARLGYGFAVGDCASGEVAVQGVVQESTARLVPCSDPHFGEVVHVGTTHGRNGDGLFPGAEWLSLESQVQCTDPFGAYVGVPMEQSSLSRLVVFPTEAQWTAGERHLVCIVYDSAGDTVGTLRAAAR
ncbi:septum formation family protein [Agromyces badenianii]|nr:septum formation family protein [Agromyces badenianii]